MLHIEGNMGRRYGYGCNPKKVETIHPKADGLKIVNGGIPGVFRKA